MKVRETLHGTARERQGRKDVEKEEVWVFTRLVGAVEFTGVGW
jgi:hypothetical protein